MRDEWLATLKPSGVPCELVVPSKSIHAAVGIGRLGDSDTLILSRGSLSLGSRVQKSLVGPRPHAVGSRAGEQLFWEVSDLYWMRHALKPGITGLAQINGFRGATHCRDDLKARLRYDLEYHQTWSLWNDLTILFATL